MHIETTSLPEVRVIAPRWLDQQGEDRLLESWSRRRLAGEGLDFEFVQDSESLSSVAFTLRGLHYQAPNMAQARLIRVLKGSILNVSVDVRVGSPRYGCWDSVEVSAQNCKQVLVPRGFLHGYLTLEPETFVFYKADNYYSPDHEGAVLWNDRDLGIEWGRDIVEISDKDATAPCFADWKSPFVYKD